MKLFVTGPSGYIGKVVVEHAVKAGHAVEGLARNPEGAAKVTKLGARPVLGELGSFDVLGEAASRADAVLHLAYIHDFSLDHNIVIDAEIKAVAALAKGAQGKPIITTSGTALAAPSPDGGETDETAPIYEGFVLSKRIVAERAVLDLAKSGSHVVSVRLPQYVYGRGGSFFVPMLMREAAKHGVSAWIEGPAKRTSTVDVDDVARFYLAACQQRAGRLALHLHGRVGCEHTRDGGSDWSSSRCAGSRHAPRGSRKVVGPIPDRVCGLRQPRLKRKGSARPRLAAARKLWVAGGHHQGLLHRTGKAVAPAAPNTSGCWGGVEGGDLGSSGK